jgi:hypothetical protein
MQQQAMTSTVHPCYTNWKHKIVGMKIIPCTDETRFKEVLYFTALTITILKRLFSIMKEISQKRVLFIVSAILPT